MLFKRHATLRAKLEANNKILALKFENMGGENCKTKPSSLLRIALLIPLSVHRLVYSIPSTKTSI